MIINKNVIDNNNNKLMSFIFFFAGKGQTTMLFAVSYQLKSLNESKGALFNIQEQ